MKNVIKPRKLKETLAFQSQMIRQILRSEKGSVAVYSAFLGLIAIGAGALSLDYGRVAVVRSQMQNRADAGAMAAAHQLDGREGAQTRATTVAFNAMTQTTALTSDSTNLDVQSINFYSEIEPDKVAATGDEDSRYAEVMLNQRKIDYFLTPILFGSTSTNHQGDLQPSATASSNPFICEAPPLMICDPAELDAALDLSLPANAGKQIQLKPPPNGGTAWGPGNYGLLALPDGSIGASDIEGALAAIEPEDCYTLDVSTAPGVKTSKVQNGINARFDMPGGLPDPAPNVINYPKDNEIEADPDVTMGSGDWDIAGYWNARHAGALPTELDGASRYQVYLYEQGLDFGRNGKQTVYPIDGALPAGFTTVSPGAADIPEDITNPDDPDVDGVPSQAVAANGYARRLLKVAVLQCGSLGIKGSHTYPTNGNYVEAFVTQTVADAPAGGIYVEVVRQLTTTNEPDFHANVRLVK
jgi:Flp pilus assembly protein TadG